MAGAGIGGWAVGGGAPSPPALGTRPPAGRVSDEDFRVTDFVSGMRKRGLLSEKAEAARAASSIYLGDAPPERLYRGRVVGLPATSPRWDPPLPAIGDKKGALWTYKGHGPLDRADLVVS